MPRRPVREKPLHTTALVLRAASWSIFGGLAVGIGTAAFLLDKYPVPVAVLGAAVSWVLASVLFTGVALALAHGAASSVGAFLHPSGHTTAPVREYSFEESLVARGWLDAAEAAYRQACAENPDDPEPRIRLARLLRDRLGRPAAAVEAFEAARRVPGIDAGRAALVTREMIELWAYRLNEPGRALTELARVAQQHAGTPLGNWATREKTVWKPILTARQGEDG